MRPKEYCPWKDYKQSLAGHYTLICTCTRVAMDERCSSPRTSTNMNVSIRWKFGNNPSRLDVDNAMCTQSCPTSYTHTISRDDKLHADSVGGFAHVAVEHQRCSWLNPHIEAQLGQETIVTTQPLPFGLHCDGWECGQVGRCVHTGRRAYCVCACVCVCVCVWRGEGKTRNP